MNNASSAQRRFDALPGSRPFDSRSDRHNYAALKTFVELGITSAADVVQEYDAGVPLSQIAEVQREVRREVRRNGNTRSTHDTVMLLARGGILDSVSGMRALGHGAKLPDLKVATRLGLDIEQFATALSPEVSGGAMTPRQALALAERTGVKLAFGRMAVALRRNAQGNQEEIIDTFKATEIEHLEAQQAGVDMEAYSFASERGIPHQSLMATFRFDGNSGMQRLLTTVRRSEER